MNESTEIMETERHLSVDQVLGHVNFIKEVMQKVMVPDQHFGIIPGCKKPSLLKAGAEVLFKAFQLRADYDENIVQMENGHREYQFNCRVYSIGSGRLLGQGMGSACTMENKWRYKGGMKEFTGNPVPKEYWNLQKTDQVKAKEAIGGPGFGIGKNPETGQWEICVFGEKIENENPADLYNTVRKMGKKRCMVDGAITVTGCSDIFTQDMEEETDKDTMKDITPKKSGPQEKQPEQAQGAKTASNPTEIPKTGQTPPPAPPAKENGKEMSVPEKVKALLAELCPGAPLDAEDLLETCSAFEGENGPVAGRRRLEELSTARTLATYGKLKKLKADRDKNAVKTTA